MAPDGSAAIVYAAQLELLRVRVAWSSRFESASDGTVSERSSLRSPARVTAESGAATWTDAALGVDGRWSGGPRLREILFAGKGGEVLWEAPSAAADVVLRLDDDLLAGRGYVERISLTLPPWRLGLRRLLWGRFVGATRSLAWISWDGRVPLALAFLDGTRRTDVTFGLDLLPRLSGHERLDTGPARVLRDAPIAGRLGALALPSSLPARILAGRERKWLAPARLASQEGCDEGFVLFEEITWP